ncbi:MAG: long-chain fatty acid--CoA ligase [Actinomycetota bacterium]|nr:long-chain fatty acid--CoA ligase [Actinomycetota bacterium]
MQPKRTIARLWRDAVAAGRPTPAYLVQNGDEWTPVSWAEAAERVDDYANGLLALGVKKGDAFSILATSRVEWALFDFALGSVGAIGAAIYANSSVKDAGYILEHSESIGVLCEDEVQRAKVDAVRAEIPRLGHVLTFDDLDDLAARGRVYAAEHPDALSEASDAIEEEDLFTYIYTSGTTGPPKGCMISHKNYYAMVAVVDDLPSFTGPEDTMLLYLPLAHNFGRLMHLSGAYVGYGIAFLPDPLQAAAALPQVRPTVFPSVPRVYEKIHGAVVAKFDAETGAKRKLIDWALVVGRRVSELQRAGKPVPPLLLAQFRLADRLVYAKVKARLGGRLRLAISGGAPLSAEIAEFFHAIDILLVEGYGLTECTTAASTNTHEAYRFGTVGRPLPGTEVKVAEDGELLIRSETVFQGYFKDPEATAEVLGADGWLRSGDIAEIDADGYIVITDRKKDIIVTAGGKNVAPQNLENDLKTSKYVSQAMVVGDRQPYIAALITLDPETLPVWAAEHGLPGDIESLARSTEVRELVQGVVDEVNADRSRYEQIKRFSILPRDFTMDDGELTPTLKLKRRAVAQHFGSELDELYDGETLNQAAGV